MSKYEPFWRHRLDRIGAMLREAAEHGHAGPMDVREIESWGQNRRWYGNSLVLHQERPQHPHERDVPEGIGLVTAKHQGHSCREGSYHLA